MMSANSRPASLSARLAFAVAVGITSAVLFVVVQTGLYYLSFRFGLHSVPRYTWFATSFDAKLLGVLVALGAGGFSLRSLSLSSVAYAVAVAIGVPYLAMSFVAMAADRSVMWALIVLAAQYAVSAFLATWLVYTLVRRFTDRG